jgi:hypothetical protein
MEKKKKELRIMNGKTEKDSVIARSFGLYERRWGMAYIRELQASSQRTKVEKNYLKKINLKMKKMNLLKLTLLSIMTFLFLSCGGKSEKDNAVIAYAKENGFPIKSNDVKNADPAILFCYSSHLYENGQKDEAVFWYYVAQYRYRILSGCSENLKAGSVEEVTAKDILFRTGVYTDKKDLEKLHLVGGTYRIDLYETIQQSLGKEINGYAYGDLEQMKSTINEVLEYEEKNPFNPMGLSPQPVFKSKEIQAEKLAKVKDSYVNQIKQITENADSIKSERTKNGLKNR